LLPQGRHLIPLEIKSSSTYKTELLKGLSRAAALAPQMQTPCLIYAGEALTFSSGIRALPHNQVATLVS